MLYSVQDLTLSYWALDAISTRPLPFKTSMKISRMFIAIHQALGLAEDARQKLAVQYGLKAGELPRDPIKSQEFQKQYSEIMAQKVEISLQKIARSELAGCTDEEIEKLGIALEGN